MLPAYFVFIGALINFFGIASYFIDTIKGKAKPNRVTWFLWALAPLIAFSAEINQGVGLQSVLTFSQGAFPLLILFASFVNKKSFWKITRFDIFCAVLSILGLILWYLTKVGNVAIFFSIISDLFAGIPTIVKSYTSPETENYKAYLFGGINAFITLLTIQIWNFANWGFPFYIFIINTIFFLLIRFHLGKRISHLIIK